MLSVSDTGAGMGKEFIEQRLFQPFDSTKGLTGMGIGVYQSREITREMGGEVHITSRPGQGSTFVLQLPAATPPDQVVGQPRGWRALMPRKLLIVEDDPGLASQMRWCLEDVDVTVAASVDEALTSVRRDPPQVITLDLGLPPDPGGMSAGLQLLDDIGNLLPQAKSNRDHRAGGTRGGVAVHRPRRQ